MTLVVPQKKNTSFALIKYTQFFWLFAELKTWARWSGIKVLIAQRKRRHQHWRSRWESNRNTRFLFEAEKKFWRCLEKWWRKQLMGEQSVSWTTNQNNNLRLLVCPRNVKYIELDWTEERICNRCWVCACTTPPVTDGLMDFAAAPSLESELRFGALHTPPHSPSSPQATRHRRTERLMTDPGSLDDGQKKYPEYCRTLKITGKPQTRNPNLIEGAKAQIILISAQTTKWVWQCEIMDDSFWGCFFFGGNGTQNSPSTLISYFSSIFS